MDKFERLKRDLDKLILVQEEQKLKYMMYGQSGDIRETDGYIQALKLVKLLIDSKFSLKEDCTK